MPEQMKILKVGADEFEIVDEAARTSLETKAEIDGTYSNMTVGNAEQIVSAVGVKDKVPYNFRTSGGANDIGDREHDTIVGGCVVFNQRHGTGNYGQACFPNTGTVTYDSTEESTTFTFTIPSEGYGYISKYIASSANHVYLTSQHIEILSISEGASITSIWHRFGSSNSVRGYGEYVGAGYYQAVQKLGANQTSYLLGFTGTAGAEVTVKVTKSNIFDLTEMFGYTVAEYINTINQEDINSGIERNPRAGVIWFRKLFPNMFYPYPYEEGKLAFVNVSSHKMTGFNQWDEEWEVGDISGDTGQNATSSSYIRSKNYIPVIPETTYCFTRPEVNLYYYCYDKDYNFIPYSTTGYHTMTTAATTATLPSNCYYIRFTLGSAYGTTYKNDVCINISWDGERDGEYEPYELNSYALDSSLKLYGLPKLDANNNLYFDGDIYKSDGTVIRRYGVVDLGDLEWTNAGSLKLFSTTSLASDIRKASSQSETLAWGMTSPYLTKRSYNSITLTTGNSIAVSTAGTVFVTLNVSSSYASVDAFKAAVKGYYLVYEKATPEVETADPFTNPQVVNDFGTEEYVDYAFEQGTRYFPVPVGHDTTYQPNLRAKLEMAPDSPSDGDGDYIVRQTSGINEYVKLVIPTELPEAPSALGNYTLQCAVDAEGNAVYSWEMI